MVSLNLPSLNESECRQLIQQITDWNGSPTSPEAILFCDEILQAYSHADGSQRYTLRQAITANSHLWNTTGPDAFSHYLQLVLQQRSPLEHLRANLLVVACTGGMGDWRDTIVWLSQLWLLAKRDQIDPQSHFEEIKLLADNKNQHGISNYSTCGLFQHVLDLGTQNILWESLPEEYRHHHLIATIDITTDQVVQPTTELFQPTPNQTTPFLPKNDAPVGFAPETGLQINQRYRTVREIARGGMGIVYEAVDLLFHRSVAVKVLSKELALSHAATRFFRESEITGRLQHPSIPPVHDLGRLPDGRPFLAMKLIQGVTFAEKLKQAKGKQKQIPADEMEAIIRIFSQICTTMAFAHSKGVIHRDLKPQNIMVGAFSEVQVMDWGLAKVLQTDVSEAIADPSENDEWDDNPEERTSTGKVMGTPAYMPPEQARGEISKLDQRADVFALGGILCTILTMKPPFAAATGKEAWERSAKADLNDAIARLDAVFGHTRLVKLAKRCLNPNPEYRPSHAGEVAAEVGLSLDWVSRAKRAEELELATDEVSRERIRVERWNYYLVRTTIALLFASIVIIIYSTHRISFERENAQSVLQQFDQFRKEDAKESFLVLQDAIAHGYDAGRFAPRWEGDYRSRMHSRLERIKPYLNDAEQFSANLLAIAMYDAAEEWRPADRLWFELRKGFSSINDRDHDLEFVLYITKMIRGKLHQQMIDRRILERCVFQISRTEPQKVPEPIREDLISQQKWLDGLPLKNNKRRN